MYYFLSLLQRSSAQRSQDPPSVSALLQISSATAEVAQPLETDWTSPVYQTWYKTIIKF